MNFDPTLYLVTDRTNMDDDTFLHKIEQALSGGVTLVQLREKEISSREYLTLAIKVKQITDRHNVPLIIDDRLDIAIAADADGVHLGQSDLPIATARKIWGRDKIIGATAKTVEQALAAANEGADYLGVGAIYPTTTKVKTVLTDIAVLNDICEAVNIPVMAIGGLNKDNIGILKNSKINGICVVSAIMKNDNPETASRELRKILNEGWHLT